MSVVVTSVAVFILLGGGLGAFAFFTYRKKLRRAKAIERGLKMVPLHIHLPPSSADTAAGGRDVREVMREKTAQAEVLYNLLAGTAVEGFKSSFYGQRHIALELIAAKGLVHFYAAVPVTLVSVVEKAIQTAYPGARMEEVEDHNIFNQEGRLAATMGGEIVLKTDYAYPVATYESLERDPMEALITALTGMGPDDGAAVQIMVRPASVHWTKHSHDLVMRLRKGKPKSVMFSPNEISRVFGGGSRPDASKAVEPVKLTNLEEAAIEKIEAKTQHPGFEVLVRLVVSTQTVNHSQQLLRDIATAFALFEAPGLNGFKFLVAADVQGLVTAFILRFFPPEMQHNVLNSEELATMFHLPDAQFVPGSNVERQASKEVDGPVSLPAAGLLFGFNQFRGSKKEIRLSREDRRRHTYIIGQTGTGKSTMLENLAAQDMLAGNGFAFIDPHGDTAEKLLGMVPKERAEDVIYFNPADTEYPLGLNLFEFKDPSQKDFLIQETISMLYKLYDPNGTGVIGPRFEQWYRNAALTLMSDPAGATFLEIPKVFTDTEYLKQKFRYLKDPTVIDFWTKEMGQTSDYHKSEMLGYFVSKFGAFQQNEIMRNIIGQTKSAFDLRDVMDNKKILIVNLSKGRIGELNSKLLGMMFVIKFQAAAMSRADMPENERNDFSLYVDEFQNFSTDSFASILSEARKYRLNLIVANQFIGQLSNEIRDAVFGNIGTIVAHRMGPEDAEFMTKQFAPVFDASDLTNIPNFKSVMRLMVGGLPSQPFSVTDLPPLGNENKELGQAVKQLSAAKFGTTKAMVEADLASRLSSRPAASPPRPVESPAITSSAAATPSLDGSAPTPGFMPDSTPAPEVTTVSNVQAVDGLSATQPTGEANQAAPTQTAPTIAELAAQAAASQSGNNGVVSSTVPGQDHLATTPPPIGAPPVASLPVPEMPSAAPAPTPSFGAAMSAPPPIIPETDEPLPRTEALAAVSGPVPAATVPTPHLSIADITGRPQPVASPATLPVEVPVQTPPVVVAAQPVPAPLVRMPQPYTAQSVATAAQNLNTVGASVAPLQIVPEPPAPVFQQPQRAHVAAEPVVPQLPVAPAEPLTGIEAIPLIPPGAEPTQIPLVASSVAGTARNVIVLADTPQADDPLASIPLLADLAPIRLGGEVAVETMTPTETVDVVATPVSVIQLADTPQADDPLAGIPLMQELTIALDPSAARPAQPAIAPSRVTPAYQPAIASAPLVAPRTVTLTPQPAKPLQWAHTPIVRNDTPASGAERAQQLAAQTELTRPQIQPAATVEQAEVIPVQAETATPSMVPPVLVPTVTPVPVIAPPYVAPVVPITLDAPAPVAAPVPVMPTIEPEPRLARSTDNYQTEPTADEDKVATNLTPAPQIDEPLDFSGSLVQFVDPRMAALLNKSEAASSQSSAENPSVSEPEPRLSANLPSIAPSQPPAVKPAAPIMSPPAMPEPQLATLLAPSVLPTSTPMAAPEQSPVISHLAGAVTAPASQTSLPDPIPAASKPAEEAVKPAFVNPILFVAEPLAARPEATLLEQPQAKDKAGIEALPENQATVSVATVQGAETSRDTDKVDAHVAAKQPDGELKPVSDSKPDSASASSPTKDASRSKSNETKSEQSVPVVTTAEAQIMDGPQAKPTVVAAKLDETKTAAPIVKAPLPAEVPAAKTDVAQPQPAKTDMPVKPLEAPAPVASVEAKATDPKTDLAAQDKPAQDKPAQPVSASRVPQVPQSKIEAGKPEVQALADVTPQSAKPAKPRSVEDAVAAVMAAAAAREAARSVQRANGIDDVAAPIEEKVVTPAVVAQAESASPTLVASADPVAAVEKRIDAVLSAPLATIEHASITKRPAAEKPVFTEGQQHHRLSEANPEHGIDNGFKEEDEGPSAGENEPQHQGLLIEHHKVIEPLDDIESDRKEFQAELAKMAAQELSASTPATTPTMVGSDDGIKTVLVQPKESDAQPDVLPSPASLKSPATPAKPVVSAPEVPVPSAPKPAEVPAVSSTPVVVPAPVKTPEPVVATDGTLVTPAMAGDKPAEESSALEKVEAAVDSVTAFIPKLFRHQAEAPTQPSTSLVTERAEVAQPQKVTLQPRATMTTTPAQAAPQTATVVKTTANQPQPPAAIAPAPKQPASATPPAPVAPPAAAPVTPVKITNHPEVQSERNSENAPKSFQPNRGQAQSTTPAHPLGQPAPIKSAPVTASHDDFGLPEAVSLAAPASNRPTTPDNQAQPAHVNVIKMPYGQPTQPSGPSQRHEPSAPPKEGRTPEVASKPTPAPIVAAEAKQTPPPAPQPAPEEAPKPATNGLIMPDLSVRKPERQPVPTTKSAPPKLAKGEVFVDASGNVHIGE